MELFQFIISKSNLIIPIPGLILMIMNFKKITFKKWSFLFFFTEQFLISTISYVVLRFYISTDWLLNLDTLFLWCFISSIFWKEVKKTVVICSSFFLISYILFLYNYGLNGNGYLLYFYVSIYAVFMIIWSFFRIFLNLEIQNLMISFKFLSLVAFLIYFSLTLISNLFDQTFKDYGYDAYLTVYLMQYFASLLFNSLLIFAIWRAKRA